jgi:hypothetical protein
MASAHLLINEYLAAGSDTSAIEIQEVYLDFDKAEEDLDTLAENMKGHWTDNHSVFNIRPVPAGIESDMWYIETYEIKE